MKLLSWIIILILLSAALLVALQLHSGYVLIVISPWRIEISLPVFGMGLLLTLLGLNLTITLLAKIWRLPSRIRNYHDQRQRSRARLALMQGIIAYFANDTVRAEKLAAQALKSQEDRAVALMLGALSAHESRQPVKRDRYLESSRESAAVQATVATLQSRLHQSAPVQVPEGTKGSE